MTMIVKRVRFNNSNMYSWIGQTDAEVEVEFNGKMVYLIASAITESTAFYASTESLFDEISKDECAEFDKSSVFEEYETGTADEFEGEDLMKRSDYYKGFLYLNQLIELQHEDFNEPEVYEYTEDCGEDIEQMDLLGLKETFQAKYPEDLFLSVSKKLDDGNSKETTNTSPEEIIFRKLLAMSTDIEIPSIYHDMEAGVIKELKRQIQKLKNQCPSIIDYEQWAKEYIETEYEKVKKEKWITVPYIFAGMGQYSKTFPEAELECFRAWINGNGSAFMGEPVPATEEEIKTAIALAADNN